MRMTLDWQWTSGSMDFGFGYFPNVSCFVSCYVVQDEDEVRRTTCKQVQLEARTAGRLRPHQSVGVIFLVTVGL